MGFVGSFTPSGVTAIKNIKNSLGAAKHIKGNRDKAKAISLYNKLDKRYKDHVWNIVENAGLQIVFAIGKISLKKLNDEEYTGEGND